MSTHRHRVIPWLAYPGGMVSAFLVYALVDTLGVSVGISAYAAVVFGAAVVTVLEFVIPYDRSWCSPSPWTIRGGEISKRTDPKN